jgi:hypothetical protein
MRTKAQTSSPQSRVHCARSDNSCSANGFDGVHETHVPREFVICIQVSTVKRTINSTIRGIWLTFEAPAAVHPAWNPRDPVDSFFRNQVIVVLSSLLSPRLDVILNAEIGSTRDDPYLL